MKVVVDASVVVKWVIPDSEVEDGVEAALELLQSIRDRRVTPVQPPHWLAEVAAVVTRLRPKAAEEALDLLDAMELPVVNDLEVMKRASRIAHELNHPLFDTLYHAVALERGATLISADGTYCRKAAPLGRLVRLDSWTLSAPWRPLPRRPPTRSRLAGPPWVRHGPVTSRHAPSSAAWNSPPLSRSEPKDRRGPRGMSRSRHRLSRAGSTS